MDTRCTALSQPLPVARRSFGAAHRWKVLGVGVAANASFSAAATGIPTTAVSMRADYHFGNAQLGLVLGAMGVGLAVSELPWGLLTDRFGDRRVLVTGLFGTAAALVAMLVLAVPSAHSIPSALIVAASLCVVGLLGGSVNGSSGRAVMSWFAEGERGLAMSIRQTAVPLGGGIGAALLPWLASTHGFAATFALLAAMCALSAVCALRWLHQPPLAAEPAHQPARGAARGPLADFAVWRVALGIGILCVPQFAILTFATVFLHDFAGVGTAGTSAAMAIVQTGAMVLRVWSGRHTDRHRNRRAYLRGSTLAAAAGFFALAVLAHHGMPAAVVLAMIVAAGVAVSAWHGVAYAELATLAGPARAGTALGMANTVVYAGLFIAPAAIPHLLAASSWAGVWLAGGVVALVALPLFPRPKKLR